MNVSSADIPVVVATFSHTCRRAECRLFLQGGVQECGSSHNHSTPRFFSDSNYLFFFGKILWRIFQITPFSERNNLGISPRSAGRVKNRKVDFVLTSFWGGIKTKNADNVRVFGEFQTPPLPPPKRGHFLFFFPLFFAGFWVTGCKFVTQNTVFWHFRNPSRKWWGQSRKLDNFLTT